jgi:hypothetical protein
MQRSPSSEADTCSAGQHILTLVQNAKKLPLYPIFSQFNPLNSISYFSKVHFNIFFPYISHKWDFPFRFSAVNCVRTPYSSRFGPNFIGLILRFWEGSKLRNFIYNHITSLSSTFKWVLYSAIYIQRRMIYPYVCHISLTLSRAVAFQMAYSLIFLMNWL